ncbi:MAG: hypothetical protein PHC99_03755, partial [Methylococcales bacterium]|nr:hypothetical protein [Methylococcales bacterium]
GGTAPAALTAAGTLNIVSLPTYSTDASLTATIGDLVVVSPIRAAGQTVTLTAGGNITLGDTVTAQTLNITAGTGANQDLAINTNVSNLAVNMSGAGNLVVQQKTGNLSVSSLTMNGGDVTFVLDSGSITFGTILGTAGNITITTKSGSITFPASALFKASDVTLSATGAVTGTLEADSLDLTAGGVVDLNIIADSANPTKEVVINAIHNNPAFNFSIDAARGVVLDASLTTSGTSTIDLKTTAGALTVNQSLTSATGAINLDAVGGMTLSSETTIKSDSGNVTLTSSAGTITMSDETVVNAGSGLITLDAQSTITLGKLKTTNANPFEITSNAGAVLDGGDSPVDIYAPNAKVVIRSVGGVGNGSAGGAIEILVKELDVINTGGGDIALEHIDDATNSSGVLLDEVHGLTIRRIENLGATAGAITVRTTDDAITLDGNIISGSTDATKKVILYAGDAISGVTSTATKVDLIGGIQTAGAGVEITADDGDITFTNYNMTNPDTLTRVASLTKGIEVLGTGDIKITAIQGSIINDKNLSVVEALLPASAGSMTIAGQTLAWQSSLLLPPANLSGYASDNPDLDWAIANTKFVVDAATQQMKLANLTDDEISQHGLKNGEIIGWKVAGTSTWKAFNPHIDWALQNKKFTIDTATGGLTFGNLADYERLLNQVYNGQEIRVDNGVEIRKPEGSFIQTTGGGLELVAKNTIGQPVAGFKYSPLSLFIDAKTLLVTSTERETSSIISVGAVEVKGNTKAGSAAGSTDILTLNTAANESQKVTNPIDAAGEDIKLIGDTVIIDQDIRSAGATITLHPTDNRPIVIGGNVQNINGEYTIDTAEFAHIKDGFEQIIIGSDIGANNISIASDINFKDSLTINAPALGGEIRIDGNLVGEKGADFVINGSGHTTHLNANVSSKSNVSINDSLQVSGNRKISAQGDLILGGKSAHFLEGDNQVGDDSLTLKATGDVTINAQIGSTDALEKLSITKAKNVTFNENVAVNGNLTINASGNVAFNSSLDVSGKITIRGTEKVTLGEKVIETDGKTLTLMRSTDVVKSLENTISYYDQADNDIFYFWTENVRL